MRIFVNKFVIIKTEKKMRNKYWRLWAKSLGEKVGATDKEADVVALIRSVIVLVNFVTCFFIIAGVIHQW